MLLSIRVSINSHSTAFDHSTNDMCKNQKSNRKQSTPNNDDLKEEVTSQYCKSTKKIERCKTLSNTKLCT